MSSLIVVAVVQAAVLAGGQSSYSDAHKITTQTGKPMVVLVGAEWCPACKTMKDSVMPQVVRDGLFGRCVYTVVDLDEQQSLGRELTSGGPIPQLIMFRRTATGWSRRKLVGGQSVSTVVRFIDDGVQADEKEKEAQEEAEAAADEGHQAAAESLEAAARNS